MEMPLKNLPGMPAVPAVTVRRGETLVGLVKSHYKAQGVQVDDRQAFLMALRVAKDNGIADANNVRAGQALRLDTLPQAAEVAGSVPGAGPATTAQVLAGRQAAANPVFERTLARAVERGFVPPEEAGAVRDRVDRMASDYGFDPDDFARVTLIESDGLNPSATNGRCHGIIQFCGGPGRGAASVGYAARAKDIGKMSVLQQLDLVDRYFQDVGLPRGGKVSLDDLYLTVLTPAARSQRAANAPLPIAGVQARILYESNERGGMAITRRSLTEGLLRNAQQAIGGNDSPSQRQLLAANSIDKR